MTELQAAFDGTGPDEGLRKLFDAVPDLVIIGAMDGPPVYVNPAARRTLGIAPNAEVETLLDYRPPGFGRYLRDVIFETAAREGVWRGETVYVTRAGASVRVSQISVLHTTADGVTYMTSYSREIPTGAQSAEALRQAEERTRFALEAARAGVWEADLQARRVIWSDSMRAVQGFNGEEFGGTLESFLALVHPDDRPAVSKVMDPARADLTDFNVEFRALWPDGSIHWIESHGRVLSDAAGKPARVLAMAQDVTERKLLETQLHHSQRIEAIGQLAGGLAHDFNNLLTAILGYARLVDAELADGDPRKPDVAEIITAGDRATQLTRQLLAFSRRQVLQPVTIDVNELVSGMSRMLGPLIGGQIDVVVSLGACAPLVRADRSQMEQVLVNLAVNARDAMERGGTLTVSTACVTLDAVHGQRLELAPGPYVALAVADTGIGMSEETRRHIFEPFFTTKERGKGTGLGLATVFGIVRQSGGSIEVTSTPGAGARFEIYLPTTQDAVIHETVVPPDSQSLAGSGTVLLVEDETAVRMLAAQLLHKAGYQVIAAANAQDALALARDTAQIDLLVSDVRMPGGSGPDVFRQLEKERPGLRVLFMSGFAEDTMAEHGIDAERVPFLQKPFAGSDLLRAVRQVIENTHPMTLGHGVTA
jgi:two-component system cell cycle sensor histidine kinase/response regulator CckA